MREGLVASSATAASTITTIPTIAAATVITIPPVSVIPSTPKTLLFVLANAMVDFPPAFLHLNGLALQIFAVQCADGGLGLLRIRHAYKTHPVGLARHPVP